CRAVPRRRRSRGASRATARSWWQPAAGSVGIGRESPTSIAVSPSGLTPWAHDDREGSRSVVGAPGEGRSGTSSNTILTGTHDDLRLVPADVLGRERARSVPHPTGRGGRRSARLAVVAVGGDQREDLRGHCRRQERADLTRVVVRVRLHYVRADQVEP